MKLRVHSFKRATVEESETGLGGYLVIMLDEIIQLDGITVRKTADGKLTLSFPARTDGHGGRHSYIRPVDNEARIEIERAVFKQLQSFAV